jgi:predicted nuclease with RNAse H fold
MSRTSIQVMEVRMTPIALRLAALRTTALRLAVFGLALPPLLSAAPVRAHEIESDIETGSGVICDTREQAQRLALLLDNDAQAAIRTVNAEAHDATACALATVAYVRGAKAGTARSKAGTFEIVEVLVIGVETRRGLTHASPAVYFTLFKVEERPA